MASSSSVLLLLLLSFLAGAIAGGEVEFRVLNAIKDPQTHANFDREVGIGFAGQVLFEATDLAWRTLGQHSTRDRKNYADLTLLVEGDMHHDTFTRASTVHLGGGYGTDEMRGEPGTFDRSQVNTIWSKFTRTVTVDI